MERVAAKVVECYGPSRRRAIGIRRVLAPQWYSANARKLSAAIKCASACWRKATSCKWWRCCRARRRSRAPTAADASRTLAANVAFALPWCLRQNLHLICISSDRYLAGAAHAGLRTFVLLNKADLASHNADLLHEYRDGLSDIGLCAKSGAGIEELRSAVQGETFLLAGQSGVGKSTLTNTLLPLSLRPTRELSDASGEGRHTTVSSAAFDMPNGGALIDSPGVRDYAPPPLADNNVQVGWPEIVSRGAMSF